MAQEETVVFPKAREVLTEADWQEVADAFAENADPLLDGGAGGSEWFRQFYRRIVNLVPEPWGLGERR
jgi:branched-chain amino acid transport system ATP-binding protein